ncbi:EF-P lysine aminoacylase EpmA [Immundisolibacter sp.]|uniref:EF-P lysine aminoacylase EpmA n=1 Tax=Immundisolibacter sp. TaxID=1934948 RepID=UPI003564EAFD
MSASMREGGDWQPGASRDTLRLRAALLADIRAFFAARQVLEVDTPLLGRAPTSDPHQHCLAVPVPDVGRRYLQPSPEFAMKRLLAAGSGSIYQVCKAFRAGEHGAHHRIEFTLLEWYRIDFDYRALMNEVEALVCGLLNRPAARVQSYGELFERYVGLDPLSATDARLWQRVAAAGIEPSPTLRAAGRDAALDILLTGLVEPALASLGVVFVYDYPASQAALARLRPDRPALAERFELYVDGLELANGFTELADAGEQRRRFEADNHIRQANGLPQVPLDEQLLAALGHGLPDCAGVALGFDRLLMVAAGLGDIRAAQAFAD